MQFATQTNTKGLPLPEILKKAHIKWYELKTNEKVEFLTTLNPDKRIFIAKFNEPTFINQRLIGLSLAKNDLDKELCHALLNSMLMQFYIESTGFGRGLGALDLSKDNLATCMMLNPYLLDSKNVELIKQAFKIVVKKDIMTTEETLNDVCWSSFNHTVLKAYGIDDYYNDIKDSLLSMQRTRLTSRDKQND